jgi:hypothetical protein
MAKEIDLRRLQTLEESIGRASWPDFSMVPHAQLVAAMDLLDREGGISQVDPDEFTEMLWNIAPEVARRLQGTTGPNAREMTDDMSSD